MAIRKFLTSVADVYAYDASDNLLFSAKTLLDSSIDVKVGSAEVRGGQGNSLLYVYYHTGAMSVALTDAQFNLGFLAETVGASVATGNDVYVEETVTLNSSKQGTVVGTPLALPNSGAIYGWLTLPGGDVEKVTFTGSTFTSADGSNGDVCCVRYYANNAASRSITIPANILPSSVRLVMEASLNSGDQAGANKIGKLQVLVPRAQLSGAFTISLKSDGVSNTPLSAMALADTDLTSAACSNTPIYAKLTEILDSVNWYDDVTALAVDGGDFALTHPATSTLKVWAIKGNSTDAPFLAPVADLTFTSGTVGTATIGAHTGIVTTVAAGSTLLKAVITSKTSIEASCTLTVS